jgi:hypothetical protein
MPNAGRTGKADRAGPERHGQSAYHIRLLFAQPSGRGQPRSFAFATGSGQAIACHSSNA